jgi:alcohol dehydrogenase class IV
MEAGKILSLQNTNMQEWKSKGVIVDPSEYGEGKYNTLYCQVNEKEKEIYQIKSQRNDPSMREVAQYLMRIKGKNEQMVIFN